MMKELIVGTLLTVLIAADCDSADVTFPHCSGVINVKKEPYNAYGDGIHDDTNALQRAINENTGSHRLLYFPPGTYLISSTLEWPKRFNGHDNWGFTYLTGSDAKQCVIRLKNDIFSDLNNPKALMWCGGFGSADWFHNYIENLTFDVGNGNPAAIALQFYSNNSGAIRNCIFKGSSESGYTGVDLAHRDMNGPLLVSNCKIEGFRTGVHTANSVNGQVFENLELSGQTLVGFANEGQTVSIRKLSSQNEVSAISSYGTLCLTEADLQGLGKSSAIPAIVNFNGGRIFVRDVVTNGYVRALADINQTPDFAAAYQVRGTDKIGSEGPAIDEYCSQVTSTLFDSPTGSLRLPIKETPILKLEAATEWANVDDFGADPSAVRDSSVAIQQAIDSGATTIFLPGNYSIRKTVIVRGKVQRVIGLGGQVNYGRGLESDFQIVDGQDETLFIEHFAHIGGGIKVDTNRTLVVRSVSDCDFSSTQNVAGAEWFFEDVVTHNLELNSQKLWARQLNIENEGTHLRNVKSDVWILGYKTERGGTLAETTNGKTEILGGFSYTTTAGKLAPMFINENSRVWTFFGEICYNNDPFVTLVKEIRNNQTKEMIVGAGSTCPYSGYR